MALPKAYMRLGILFIAVGEAGEGLASEKLRKQVFVYVVRYRGYLMLRLGLRGPSTARNERVLSCGASRKQQKTATRSGTTYIASEAYQLPSRRAIKEAAVARRVL
jgi:hypothetical protein